VDSLLDFGWIRSKLNEGDLNSLCAAYDQSPDNEAARLVQRALRFSTHVLERHKDQLKSQMSGRLAGVDNPRIVRLLEQVNENVDGAWLKPLLPTMPRPTALLASILPPMFLNRVKLTVDDDARLALVGDDELVDIAQRTSYRIEEPGTTASALTADGRSVLVGTYWGEVRFGSSDPGASFGTLGRHEHTVDAVAITGDGRLSVSASHKQTVEEYWASLPGEMTLCVWDVASGRMMWTFTEPSYRVAHLAISLDGTRLVSLSSAGKVMVWDVASGLVTRTVDCGEMGLHALAVSPDGKWLVSQPFDGVLRVWDLETMRVVHDSLEGHARRIETAAVSQDGQWLVSADPMQGQICDIASGTVVSTLSGHQEEISSIGINASGNWILTGGRDQLRVWRNLKSVSTEVSPHNLGSNSSACVSANGRWLVILSGDHIMQVWNLDEQRMVARHHMDENVRKVAAVDPAGKWALMESALYDQDGRGDTWFEALDLETGRVRGIRVGAAEVTKSTSVRASADGRWVLLDGRLWDIVTNQIYDIGELVLTPDHFAVNASTNELTAIFCEWSWYTSVYDISTGVKRDDALVGLSGRHTQTAVSGNGDRVLGLNDLSQFSVYQRSTGETHAISHDEWDWYTNWVINADGNRAVSWSGYATALTVWDLDTRKAIATFVGDSGISHCVFVPQSQRIAVCEDAGYVNVLELRDESAVRSAIARQD
jgi:WD40 repeat protein